jgi:hypothetical protein
MIYNNIYSSCPPPAPPKGGSKNQKRLFFFLPPFGGAGGEIALFLLIFLFSNFSFAQTLTGSVSGITPEKKYVPLNMASVFWENTEIGTFTDSLGKFEIPFTHLSKNLIVNYIGYKSDTVEINPSATKINIQLSDVAKMDSVTIQSRQSGSIISTLTPGQTETLTMKELYKAACCNLSESFQTNGAIDVSFSDAVTGAKQIRLLGLSGIYSQIITENAPSIRGLATTYGLGYIPGPWMEKIDISKGAASVLNGYEGVTGQINVEYKKPQASPRLFISVYGNQMTRMESSVNYARAMNKKKTLATMLMVHGNMSAMPMDRNKDGFNDEHLQKQFSAHNRWTYFGENGLEIQFSAKILSENRKGGEMLGLPNPFHAGGHIHTLPYHINVNTDRQEFLYKTGWLSPKKPYKSVGLVVTGVNHAQKSNYGLNTYNGNEQFVSAKWVYQTILGNTNHTIRTGMSYLFDNYKEKFNATNYLRKESVPGIFGEYTYNYVERFSAVVGFRADYHNLYGMIYTPRAHLRYKPTEKMTIRISGGNATRVANIFADNPAIWVSARSLEIKEKLLPEKAWNYGISFIQKFSLFERDANFIADFYRTDFQNQVVVDREVSNKISFYNLNGKSFSNAFQVEMQFEPIDRLEIKGAYKWNEVKTTYISGLKSVPFVPNHRGFINAAYSTNMDRWKFDVTLQMIGKSRIPSLEGNTAATNWTTTSPAFVQLFAQISRNYKDWEFYLGGENLTNYRQQNPIIDVQNPFSQNFDAAMIWGPIYGSMIYGGFRWKLDKLI